MSASRALCTFWATGVFLAYAAMFSRPAPAGDGAVTAEGAASRICARLNEVKTLTAGFLRTRAIFLTQLTLLADQTCAGMLQHDQRQNIATQLPQRRRFGLNHHAVGYRRGARSGKTFHPLDLYHAHPTRTERLQRFMRTQMRYLDPTPQRTFEYAFPIAGGNVFFVNS